MLVFWIIVAVMILVALAMLAPAFLRHDKARLASNREQNIAIAREHLKELETQLEDGQIDQQTFDKEKDEIEKGLIEDIASDEQETMSGSSSNHGRWAVIVAGGLVPVIAVSMYLVLGSPEFISKTDPHAGVSQSKQPPTASELVTMLEERIKTDPDNPDSWFMLGRLYATEGRYDDAVKAYEKLAAVTDNNPTALVVLADALAMTQDGKISGRPLDLVEQALKTQPDNVTALWLAGKGYAEQAKYQVSLDYFSRAAKQLSDKPELLAQLSEQMAQVQAVAKASGVELKEVDLPAPAAATAVSVKVDVKLDPAMQSVIEPSDTLFIFARLPSGPPMPVAAIKRQASELPLSVELNDGSLLRPGKELAQYPELKLAARISKSGQPLPTSGDLQSKPLIVHPGQDASVTLTIDQRIP